MRDRRNAKSNPFAQVKGDFEVAKLLAEPYLVSPLRKHDCPPISDGASAIVLAAGDRRAEARASGRPGSAASSTSSSRRTLGVRDLTRSRSTELAAAKAGVGKGGIDVAELHAPVHAPGDPAGAGARPRREDVTVNPSGGALAAQPDDGGGPHAHRRGGARGSRTGSASRAVAHATSGPCLQQNLVCVLEG